MLRCATEPNIRPTTSVKPLYNISVSAAGVLAHTETDTRADIARSTIRDTANLTPTPETGDDSVAQQPNPAQNSLNTKKPISDRDLQRVIIDLLLKEPREHQEKLFIARIRNDITGVTVKRIQDLLQKFSFEGRIV